MNRKEIDSNDAAILFMITLCFTVGLCLLMSYYSVPNQIIAAIVCIKLAVYMTLHRIFLKVIN